jgi:hypothetical protein
MIFGCFLLEGLSSLHNWVETGSQGEYIVTDSKSPSPVPETNVPENYFRFHLPHLHHFAPFGNDWFALLQQNTQLTELVKDLSQRIEVLTVEMHSKVVQIGTKE